MLTVRPAENVLLGTMIVWTVIPIVQAVVNGISRETVDMTLADILTITVRDLVVERAGQIAEKGYAIVPQAETGITDKSVVYVVLNVTVLSIWLITAPLRW